jgi:predicted kinase
MQIDSLAAQIFNAYALPAATTATPILFILSGLPGTGKSYLARKLAERLPLVIVNSDFVRATLTAGKPNYTADESELVHRVGRAVLKRILQAHRHALYDATNLAEWHREKLYRVAAETGARLVIVRTTAPDEIVQARLRQRFAERNPFDYSEADWHVHEQLKSEVEPIARPHLVVDTSGDIDAAIHKILRAAR